MKKQKASTVTFSQVEMLEMLDTAGDDILINEIKDTARWATVYRLVFRRDGKLYETSYREGATEYQDESPWEGMLEVPCFEVEAYERTVTDYRPVRFE